MATRSTDFIITKLRRCTRNLSSLSSMRMESWSIDWFIDLEKFLTMKRMMSSRLIFHCLREFWKRICEFRSLYVWISVICNRRSSVMSLTTRLCLLCITWDISAPNVHHQLNIDGASLIYTSIKNNSNLNLIYEYALHLAYAFPFRLKSEDKN